jgi:hypothetical protein
VAAEVGCSIGTVDARLNEAGIRGPRGNGAREPEIIRRDQSGESLSQVGVAMGMTKTAVHEVLRRLGVPRSRRGRTTRGRARGKRRNRESGGVLVAVVATMDGAGAALA